MRAFIAVVGSAVCGPEIAALAEAVGQGLAESGAVLVCGGRGGVMEAACRGAKSAGGTTVGILPGDSVDEANPYVDIPIPTGMGEARNALVVRSAQAVIAIGGEYGTLSEIALALKIDRPVIGLETWELSKKGQRDSGILYVSTPAEAVELALTLAGR